MKAAQDLGEKLIWIGKNVKCGYTFIERGENGLVVNSDFPTFESFQQCCMTAEKSIAAKSLKHVDVVPCEYNDNGDLCHPQVMSILRTFKRSG